MQCGSCGEAIDVMDPSSLDHVCATQGASGKMKCELFILKLTAHPPHPPPPLLCQECRIVMRPCHVIRHRASL